METKLKICGLAFALTGFTAAAAQAQSNPVVLPQVVISPTQIPTPQSEIASSVTVITAEEIERDQRRTVPDLLMAQPGLNVVQTGGPGGQTAVFIRGTNANHVKVLLDGIDVSDPTSPNGAVDFAHLLTSNLERIEILRGPQSGLYGANSIGGVISLTTKKGSGPAKVSAQFEGGSFGTFNQSANLSGSLDRFNYTFDIAHLQSTRTPVTPAYYLPPGQARINDYYDNRTYSTRLGFDLTDNFSLNLFGRLTDSTLRFTNDSFDFGTFLFVPNTAQSDQAARQAYGRAEAVWSAFDGRFVNRFGINHTDSTRTSQDPAPALPSTFKGDRNKYDWRGDVVLAPGQILVLGLEQETESINVPAIAAQRNNKAGFVELQLEWAKRFFLASNIRHDDNENFGGHSTWRVAPAFIVPGTETKLKATYGTGFKAPTLLELYGDDPINLFVANRALKPEESRGYDFGFEQPIANDRARFGLTYYRNDIKNLINFVVLAPGLFSNANIGEAQIYGYEAFVAVTLSEQFKIRADYTQTNANDAITGAALIRRPRDKYSATAIWQPNDQLALSSTYLYVSQWQDYDRASSAVITAPGYSVVNLAANYKANKNLQMFARLDNIFDQQYENPYGWLRPGRGFFVGVRANN